jgi:serine/threonine-protein kinase PpkA
MGLATVNATALIIKPSAIDKSTEPKIAEIPSQALKTWQLKGVALAPQLVAIPAGCFQMGSPDSEAGHNADEVLHRVCVKGFQLASHELTFIEFKHFVVATNYLTDAEKNTTESGCWSYEKDPEKPWDWRTWASWKHPIQGAFVFKDYPVTCVSSNDVTAYIAWLNKETGQLYRLPTEAEWEYAARAGTVTARYWGNNPDISCGYANVADVTQSGSAQWPEMHKCQDGHFFATKVGSLQANNFGLHDMLGNVGEWTCSKYEEKYTGGEAQCIPQNGISEEVFIAIRGGAWNADPSRLRAAYRTSVTPWTRQANLGFRLVKEH